jgi:hypothetical protein
MYARIVRFTDVSQDRIDQVKAMIEENDGPPEGVDSTGMKLYYDADQQTAVFVGGFTDREKLDAADEVLGAMDPDNTPGSRASVDRAELILEADA